MDQITDWIVRTHAGDIASVAGILISLVGFIFTLWNVIRSRRAADRAEQAVNDLKRRMTFFNAAVDTTAAIGIMEEIRRLHRAEEWAILPDRYSALKRHLLTIRASNVALEERHRNVLATAIQTLRLIEDDIERAIANDQRPDVPTLNRLVSRNIDHLHEIFVEMRNAVG
jgi:phosphoglycerate-specific signal transduction histidine kinase